MTNKSTAVLLFAALCVNSLVAKVSNLHLDDSDLRHHLQQSNSQYNFNSSTAEVFAHLDAFLIGFRSSQIFPSALNCSNNVETAIYVWNQTEIDWKESEELIFRDKLFDTTYFVSYSLAPSTDNCFGSFIELFVWQQE